MRTKTYPKHYLLNGKAFGWKLYNLGSLLFFGLLFGSTLPAFGEVVERNDAKPVIGQQQSQLNINEAQQDGDDQPLGVDLSGIVIVNASVGNNFSGLPIASDWLGLEQAGPKLQTPRFIALMEKYRGRGLSLRLINEIRADITRYYRMIDKPLVAVNVAEQEISGGVLQVDVIEFHLAGKSSQGSKWTNDEFILDRIRVQRGDEILASRLVSDLNWLNLNPYRNVVANFEPGDKPGTTQLLLRSKEQRPWTAYLGYANSGQTSTDEDRVFVGATFANLPFLDHQISYQLTAAPDTISDGRLGSAGSGQSYASHSLSYFAPIQWDSGVRSKFLLQGGYVASNALLTNPFSQQNSLTYVYGEVAFPTRKLGALVPEFYVGLDYKRQKNDVFFATQTIDTSLLEVMQLVGGMKVDYRTPVGGLDLVGFLHLRGVYSPGNLGGNNNNEAFVSASGDSLAESRYSYLYASLEHQLRFPRGVLLGLQLTTQIANDRLPDVEKLTIGGSRAVRGYDTNLGAGEDGAFARATLYLPTFALIKASDQLSPSISPFVFSDIGEVREQQSNQATRLSSAGLGFDLTIGKYASASVTAAYALRDGGATDGGDVFVHARVDLRF